MEMNISTIIVIMVLGFTLFVFGYVIFDELYTGEAYDKACEDIGMVKGVNNNLFGGDYCLGDGAHQAIFECKGFAWNKKCKANLILVK